MSKASKQKILVIVLVLATVLSCVLLMTACNKNKTKPQPNPDNPPAKATVTGITVSGAKATFEYGEEFASTGLKVVKQMSDKTTVDVTANEYTVDSSAYNKDVAGQYDIVVKLNGTEFSATYKVTVAEKPEPEVIKLVGKYHAGKEAFSGYYSTDEIEIKAGQIVEVTYTIGDAEANDVREMDTFYVYTNKISSRGDGIEYDVAKYTVKVINYDGTVWGDNCRVQNGHLYNAEDTLFTITVEDTNPTATIVYTFAEDCKVTFGAF